LKDDKAQLKAVHPASLKSLNGVPGIDYQNDTVNFEAADYQEAYDGITALIRVATQGYTSLLRESIRHSGEADAIFQYFEDLLVERWGDVESGRWNPPELSNRENENRKYFGAR
jgi:hypothetical protein